MITRPHSIICIFQIKWFLLLQILTWIYQVKVHFKLEAGLISLFDFAFGYIAELSATYHHCSILTYFHVYFCVNLCISWHRFKLSYFSLFIFVKLHTHVSHLIKHHRNLHLCEYSLISLYSILKHKGPNSQLLMTIK